MDNAFMKGQTLVEVLIALSIGVLILAAIGISVTSSLNNAQYSKNQNSASGYAQQGMEIVRSIKNFNWSTFKSLSGSYCLDKNSSALIRRDPTVINGCSHEGLPAQNVDIFARQVDIENPSLSCPSPTASDNGIKITVSVSWADGKCKDTNKVYCHQVQLINCFSNVNVIPTP